MKIWDDELIKKLKGLREQKLSAGEIAKEMGITRNAVIGKLARLGLMKNGTVKVAIPKETIAVAKQPRAPNRTIVFDPPPPPVVAPRPLPVTPITPTAIHILDLQDHHCRAVLDGRAADGLSLYCGAPKAGGSSYCATHLGLYYQPKETSDGKAGNRQQSVRS